MSSFSDERKDATQQPVFASRQSPAPSGNRQSDPAARFSFKAYAAMAIALLKGAVSARIGKGSVTHRLGLLESRSRQYDQHLQVLTVMDWIAHASVHHAPLISIVLATRNRHGLLPRAIESVQTQSYANWELVIVDDGSTDETPALLAALKDNRIRSFRTETRGVCAARNSALAKARGEIIAYLDDDNIMHPQWLKSVAWGFEQRPEAGILYGAFVIDDLARVNPSGGGELPRMFFRDYDHKAIAQDNIADIGCIAHRAHLPEARFDESLREMGDWDLLLRLTRDAPPAALPAIACYYTTDAPNRLSFGPTHEANLAYVRRKNKR